MRSRYENNAEKINKVEEFPRDSNQYRSESYPIFSPKNWKYAIPRSPYSISHSQHREYFQTGQSKTKSSASRVRNNS